MSLHEQGMAFSETDLFSCALNTTKCCLVLCKAYKVRSKTRSSPTLGVTLAVQDALLLSSSHAWGCSTNTPMLPSTPRHTLIKKTVTCSSQCLGHQGGTTDKSEQQATALFACPEDWLCTLVPEEAAHCKSIIFPVASWMGKVPATSCNPSVMQIAGCYEDAC